MKINIRVIVLIYSLLVLPGYVNAAHQFTLLAAEEKSVVTSHQYTELSNYLNTVLIEAGFPDETRIYLMETARPQLLKVNPQDFESKKRLLQSNLAVYLHNLAEKNQTPETSDVIRKEYFKAEEYEHPWDYVLSKPVLNNFKAHHIFGLLKKEDIAVINEKFCPVWPFCEN